MQDDFTSLMRRLGKKYRGRYVTVVEKRVVATGSTRLEAYQKAQKKIPEGIDFGVYYIPSLKDFPLLLRPL